jgi:hypothetical protein
MHDRNLETLCAPSSRELCCISDVFHPTKEAAEVHVGHDETKTEDDDDDEIRAGLIEAKMMNSRFSR